MTASEVLSLPELLERSDSMVASWRESLAESTTVSGRDTQLRGQLLMDACVLSLDHGQALRELLRQGLESSALALLRVQHEAVLRAAWVLFCASESMLQKLAAPLTPETLKRASNLPKADEMLAKIERSAAPEPLKKGLREFRDLSWAGANSYTHAGFLPMGRVTGGHPQKQLIQVVQVSNAHSYAASMLLAGFLGRDGAQGDLNVIAIAHPGCILRA